MNTLRNYAIDPLHNAHHPHKELLRHVNALVNTRNEKGLLIYIEKVKSHTGGAYNDKADADARGVLDGYILPDITLTSADPSIGGL